MARPRPEVGLILRHILGRCLLVQRDRKGPITTRSGAQIIVRNGEENANVYFQPPPGLQMRYPCIVYERADVETQKANNKIYRDLVRYTVTVIDKNPDSDIYKRIMDSFAYCSYDRSFKSNNFNHDVLTLYY